VVIALGTVTAVLIVGLAMFWFVWRKRRRRSQDPKGKSSPEYGNFIASASSSPSILESSTAHSTYTYKSTRTHSHSRRHGTGASAVSSSSSARLQSVLVNDIANVRIPFEKVIAQRPVNSGGYGEVYRGTYHGETVAIKMLLPATRRDIRQINAFLAEVKMMAAMEHERIVRFIGVAWDSLSDLCAVSEYMEGGDLRTLLTQFEARERRPKGFDRDKARIALHVMHALTYLHSLDPVVLHRDLKSKNILLTADLDAKITDFGVSRESSDKTMTAGVGTSLWMAPEVMMGERYDEKADMFSFGVVLSELDSHLLPYAMAKETDSGRVLPDTALLQMVSLGRLRIEMSSNAPQAVAELAYACVALNPRNRPSAPEALYCLDRIFKYDWNR